MFERMTPASRRAIIISQEIARSTQASEIRPIDMFIALLLLPDEGELAFGATECLRSVCPNYVQTVVAARDQLGDLMKLPRLSGGHIPLSPNARKIMERALRAALQLGSPTVDTKHLLIAMIEMATGKATKNGVPMDADEHLRSYLESRLPELLAANAIPIIEGQARPDNPPQPEPVLYLSRELRELLLGMGGTAASPVTTWQLLEALSELPTTPEVGEEKP